jgi:prepilin-type N-terminal cleavage/methylation domain-containing protein
MLKKMKKNEKGFTLVELIVVIAILGILSVLIVPKIMGNVKEARDQREISNARTIASEVSIHNATAVDKDPATAAGKTIPGTLPDAGATKALVVGDLTGTDLVLDSGISFPDTKIVDIIVDSAGNASIKINKK